MHHNSLHSVSLPKVFFAASILIQGLLFAPVQAAWLPGGNLIASGPNDQMMPVLLPDGSGGVFEFWIGQGLAHPACGGQHVDGNGATLWGSVGVMIPLPFSVFSGLSLPVSDQQGGAILLSTLPNDITYAQRVDGLGNSLWGGTGADLYTNPAYNSPVSAQPIVGGGSSPVSDPAGVIAAWAEQVTSAGNADVYAQRLDDSANPLWSPVTTPVTVCVAAGDQIQVATCTDGTTAASAEHGAFISWLDGRTGFPDDIYINRISNAGVPSWPDGIGVCSIHTADAGPVMDAFGANGALLVWPDARRVAGAYDLYAQDVGSDGSMAWTTDGVPVCEAPGMRLLGAMCPFGAGGELISFSDLRSGVSDIYVQAIDASGNRLWGSGGRAICTATGIQAVPQLVRDNAGGAFVIWFDRRSGHYDIYGQRIDANGNALWQADGALLVPLNNLSVNEAHAIADGSGGFYLAWHNKLLDPSYDVYLSRFTASGAVAAAESPPPVAFRLAFAAPNPARGAARFAIELPTAGSFSAEVLDLQGRVVRRLVRSENWSAGSHSVVWDGRAESGNRAGPGIYFTVAQLGTQSRILRLVELR